MKPEKLMKSWDVPEPPKLMPKQISIRIPILTAARLNALGDLFPGKNKSDIINDLIASALINLEKGMESERGEHVGTRKIPYDGFFSNETDQEIYEDVGFRGEYRAAVEKHVRAIEAELKLKDPLKVRGPFLYGEDDNGDEDEGED